MTSARTLSLLAALASPLFLAAAIAGWLYGVWPATPVTFAIAALVVVSGPLLAIYHVARAGTEADDDYEPSAPTARAPRRTATAAKPPTRQPGTFVITPKAAAARAFAAWRNTPHPAIEHRERERHANAVPQAVDTEEET